VVTDPTTHTNTQTNPQAGPITIHCAAKLSAQCNKLDLMMMRMMMMAMQAIIACALRWSRGTTSRIRPSIVTSRCRRSRTTSGCTWPASCRTEVPATHSRRPGTTTTTDSSSAPTTGECSPPAGADLTGGHSCSGRRGPWEAGPWRPPGLGGLGRLNLFIAILQSPDCNLN